MKFLLIGIGGAFGSIMRVLIAAALPATWLNIPVNILLVNVIGCFISGVFSSVFAIKLPSNHPANDLLTSGFLGGFTTFSAFALDVGRLYEKDLYIETILYISAGVILSLSAFFVGIKLTRTLIN